MNLEIKIWKLVGGNSDSRLTVDVTCQEDREIESNNLLYNFEFADWGILFQDSRGNWQWRAIESKVGAKFKKAAENFYCKLVGI